MTAARARDSLVTVLVCSAFLSAVAAALVFARSRPETPDAVVMVSVAKGIVERQDFTPARDWRDRPMPEQKHGLGLSLLFAGPYALARVVDADPIRAAMATNALVFGCTVTVMLALARLLALPWRQALVATLLTAAGTPLLPFVATGFSELAVAAAVTLGLVAVAAAGEDRAWAAPLAGGAAGAATLLRTDSLVLVLPLLAVGLVVASRDWRSLWPFALAAAPFLLTWGWYNHTRYGAPWRLGYYEDEGFIYPFTRGLYGLLMSPGRGLLWYAPLVVVAVFGFRAACRRSPVVAAVAAVIFLARPLFYASWAWDGGWTWGPRFLVPAMPALLVGVVEVVRRFRSWPRFPQAIVTLVVLVSVSVQAVGASTDYLHSNAVIAQRYEDFHAGLLSWDHFPILEQAKWMFTRRDVFVGRALPPTDRPFLFAGMMGTALLLALSAASAARSLDGGSQMVRSPAARETTP
jgi:hypothetical protein